MRIYTCVKLWVLIGFLSVCVHGTCLPYACIIRLQGGRIRSLRIQGPFQSPDKYRAGLQAKTLEELQLGERNISLPLVLHCSKPAPSNLSLRKDLQSVCAEKPTTRWILATLTKKLPSYHVVHNTSNLSQVNFVNFSIWLPHLAPVLWGKHPVWAVGSKSSLALWSHIHQLSPCSITLYGHGTAATMAALYLSVSVCACEGQQLMKGICSSGTIKGIQRGGGRAAFLFILGLTLLKSCCI